jgi:hypothetical protein
VNFRPLIVVQDKVSMVAIKRTLQEGKQKVKKKLIPSYFIPLTPYLYNHLRRLPENESAPGTKRMPLTRAVPGGPVAHSIFMRHRVRHRRVRGCSGTPAHMPADF